MNSDSTTGFIMGMLAGLFVCLAGKMLMLSRRKKPTSVAKKVLKLLNAMVCMVGSSFGI